MSPIGGRPTFDDIDAAQRWVLATLMAEGEAASPRGMATREVLGRSFVLTRPRARLVASPARKWNAALAVGEFCWHASGSRDVAALAHYAPRWRDFSEDGVSIRGSCYGHRIFSADPGRVSQWAAIVALLRSDPASRRAVFDLSEATLDATAADVSCTSTFQALARDGRLHVLVTMRSNDAVWGLPYDVFLFTMLQELLAVELGLELGWYGHSVGSLHVYERHFGLVRRVLTEPPSASGVMAAMGPVEGLPAMLAAERAMREGGVVPTLTPYWAGLAALVRPARVLA